MKLDFMKSKTLIIIGVFFIYIGTYWFLSRWSERVIVKNNFPSGGFYYIPVSPQTMAEQWSLQGLNEVLKIVFFPCWYIDTSLFNGPAYAYPSLIGLEKQMTPRANH